MSGAAVIIKAELKDDIRRFSTPSNITFADLQSRLRQLYGLSAQTISLKYVDDEKDLVTLSTQDEMEEALRVASRQNFVLRIFVFLPDMQPPAQLEFKQQQALTASLTLPSILPSQLPIISIPLATVEPAAAAKASPADKAVPPPAALSLTLTLSSGSDEYIPIAQRTLALAQATSVRCQEIAEDIRQKTAKIVQETSLKTNEDCDKAIRMAEQFKAPETQHLSAATAFRVDELSTATSNSCVDIADKISAHTLQYSKAAEVNEELAQQWNTLAMQTTQRVNELAAALTQRLLSL
jgi:hypothetical protein